MKKQLISNKLFRTYTMIFVIVLTIVLILFTVFFALTINTEILDTQKQMVNNITQNIENYFSDLNNFSMDLIHDEEFKIIVIDEMPDLYKSGLEFSDAFNRLYKSSFKMFEKSFKVGVYTKSDYYVWLGNNFFFNKSHIKNIDDYVDYSDSGIMHIERYDKNAYVEKLATSDQFKEELTDSICLWRTMSINNRFGKGQAILQVEADGEDFDKYMDDLSVNSNINAMSIHVTNAYGDILYSKGGVDVLNYMRDGKINPGKYKEKRNFVNIQKVLSGNIYVFYVAPIWSYYIKLIEFIAIALIVAVLAVLTIMVITFRLSQKLSGPIEKIISQIETLNTDNFKKVETEIFELDFLAETIASLHHNLDDSINQIVLLKSAEVQSKMLALQAQMQPHFLYNALMTVSAIADENGAITASKMCKSLTLMLRYISSDKEKGVPVFEELKHLNNYIDIMKERFSDTQINIDVPLELMHIYLPKLVIQPIVENSFKYSNNVDLKIKVTGKILPNGFYFDICDNGTGFEEEVIINIKKKCEEIQDKKNDLSISGMGIPNIYLRLKMFFKDELIFNIKNVDSGACVRIGMEKKQDND